jgi:hypothetical protein
VVKVTLRATSCRSKCSKRSIHCESGNFECLDHVTAMNRKCHVSLRRRKPVKTMDQFGVSSSFSHMPYFTFRTVRCLRQRRLTHGNSSRRIEFLNVYCAETSKRRHSAAVTKAMPVLLQPMLPMLVNKPFSDSGFHRNSRLCTSYWIIAREERSARLTAMKEGKTSSSNSPRKGRTCVMKCLQRWFNPTPYEDQDIRETIE